MIEIIEGIEYFPDCKTLLLTDNSVGYDEEKLDISKVGNYKVLPWGKNNLLPQEIIAKIEKSEIMGANIAFNRNVAYGIGPVLAKVIKDPKTNKMVDYYIIDDGEEYEFFERNDLPMYIMNTLSDMIYFHNAFSELIVDKDWKKIYSIRNKEAAFSRWGVNEKKEIVRHLYLPDWKDPASSLIVDTPVLDEFDSFNNMKNILKAKKSPRWIYSIYMPSPGRVFYSRPEWYSLFDSGWYTQSVAIPEIKKTILQNKLGVKHIIYVSPKYYQNLYNEKKISSNDIEGMRVARNEDVDKMRKFLSGAENAEKAMVAMKEFMPAGNSLHEEKYIEIETIENKMGDGEFIADLETSANVICYAMGVHSSLIGASPGKSSGSMSGTDKRELFIIKQSLMKGMIDRCMRALLLVKRVNNWPKDMQVLLPEYIFTTMDQNKSGKEESTKTTV